MLIDQILPTYQINEIHRIIISAQPEKVYRVILYSKEISDSIIFRTLTRLRGMPSRILSNGEIIFPAEPMSFHDLFQKTSFSLLNHKENKEIVLNHLVRIQAQSRMVKVGVHDLKAIFRNLGSRF